MSGLVHQLGKMGGEMTRRRTPDVPGEVHDAADSAWNKWREKLASVVPPETNKTELGARRADLDTGKPPEQRMIEKIKRRMAQYPEWYETDPAKVASSVAEHLERIGTILERELPKAKDPVPVWDIPLSVFNWLVETDEGESFVHGALSAWSRAEEFNAANDARLTAEEGQKLRAPLFEIAPVLLKAVLEELLPAKLRLTFAEKFAGSELKYLELRVQLPPKAQRAAT